MKTVVAFLIVGLALAGCSSAPCDITPVSGVCKSCKPYFVRGSWHYPQKHYEYDKTGKASWYGPGFHGKAKANGEIYNQHEVSAAHPTLPLPCVVQVTNLENGRSVNLIIDDRGPYVYNRLIDLSVGAAKHLGVYNKGVAQVRVKTLVYESKALSDYLAQRNRRRDGRTWAAVYRENIQGSPLPPPIHGHANSIKRNQTIAAMKRNQMITTVKGNYKQKPNRVTTNQEDDLHRLIAQHQA